jgi:hypothetical protein
MTTQRQRVLHGDQPATRAYDANPAAPVLCHLPGQSTFEGRRFRLEPARRWRIF